MIRASLDGIGCEDLLCEAQTWSFREYQDGASYSEKDFAMGSSVLEVVQVLVFSCPIGMALVVNLHSNFLACQT